MKRIALFASGNGTNVQRICEYFKDNTKLSPCLLIFNRKDAYVQERAKNLGLEAIYVPNSKIQEEGYLLELLQSKKIDGVVLAGFLSLIPADLIQAYPSKIINIHPALLPKFGGAGMYGAKVHQAVIDAKETQTGISIHYVNEKYDEGGVIFQAVCEVSPQDTVEDVAVKIHDLEYTHFPKVVEMVFE